MSKARGYQRERIAFSDKRGDELLNVAMMTRAALMAIPLPFSPVPFTVQVLAVILSGFLLGVRYGALAQAIYLLIGAFGVPVFAQFKGGLGVVLGPTGGYL